jgi:branched-chain amino acid transport system substrate-binding protein
VGKQMTEPKTGFAESINRRRFMQRTGATGALLAGGNLLAACGVKKSSSSSSSSDTFTIGLVTPRTGEASGFGEVDPYIIGLVKKATKDGIKGGDGKTYKINIVAKDSQSSPTVAAQVAADLINSTHIDLMLTSSTPEVVNPVSDACEAAGVPCISTVVPWQAWYYGRGGSKPNAKGLPVNPAAYKFTYHFSFGVETFATAYFTSWNSLKTNKVVGLLYPNDADGSALRAALPLFMKGAGFTVVDTGPYTDGLQDFSAQIAKLKSHNAEIFNTFPLPPDFATFWKQAAQQGYQPIIPQIAKTGLFPSQVEALGKLGHGLVGTAFWTPTFPYSSPLFGQTSQQLADGYTSSTGKQWTQMVGSTSALWDVGIGSLQHATEPKNKVSYANSIASLNVNTPLGPVHYGTGPAKNVVVTTLVNCQWIPATSGKYPLDLVVVDNAADKMVPVAAKLKPYPDFQ